MRSPVRMGRASAGEAQHRHIGREAAAVTDQPFEPDRRIELLEGGFGPVGAAENRRFARKDLRANLLRGWNQCGGDITATQVFSERGRDLPRDDVAVDPVFQTRLSN